MSSPHTAGKSGPAHHNQGKPAPSSEGPAQPKMIKVNRLNIYL